MAIKKKGDSINVLIKQAQVDVARAGDSVQDAKELQATKREELAKLVNQKKKGAK